MHLLIPTSRKPVSLVGDDRMIFWRASAVEASVTDVFSLIVALFRNLKEVNPPRTPHKVRGRAGIFIAYASTPLKLPPVAKATS